MNGRARARARARTRAGTLATLLLGGVAPLAGQQFEPGIYELTVPGLTQRVTTRVLVDSAGRVLAPLPDILLLTGIPVERTGNLWIFEWPPPSFRTEFTADSGTVTRAGS